MKPKIISQKREPRKNIRYLLATPQAQKKTLERLIRHYGVKVARDELSNEQIKGVRMLGYLMRILLDYERYETETGILEDIQAQLSRIETSTQRKIV